MSELPTPDFLGGESAPELEPEIQAVEPDQTQPAPEPANEPEPAPEPVPEPLAAQETAKPYEPVPLATFLDLRDKLARTEREAQELRAYRQQQEAARQAQPAPDPYQDPEAYQAHQQAEVDARIYGLNLNMSRRLAEVQHGPDVVKAAFDWGLNRCDQDPHFNAKVRSSQDPVGEVVAEWKREQLLARLDPTDFDAFQAWKASQGGQAPTGYAPQAAQPASQRPQAPRPSLAAGPSAGASASPIPKNGEDTFDAMFRP